MDRENNVVVKLKNIELTRFADGEVRPYIQEDVCGKHVVFTHPLYPEIPDKLIQFLLIVDAIKRGKPKSITAVIPYLPYLRQSRVHRKGEPLSAKVLAHLLSTSGIDRVITIDVHNLSVLAFFSVPILHLSAMPLLAREVKAIKDTVIVSPDAGSAERAKEVADIVHCPLVTMKKKRSLEKGDVITNMAIHGDVRGKTAVIVDDIISTGGTIARAATLLKNRGAKKIIVIAVHGLFSAGAKRVLEHAEIDRLIVTDTIQRDKQDLPVGTETVSVAPLLEHAVHATIKP